MKIATFNIQNIFHRHSDLVEMEHEKKSEIWREEFEALLFRENRSARDFIRMRELANLLGFHKAPFQEQLSMQNIDGNLHIKSHGKVMETKATYLTDWNGWTKLKSVPISKKAIKNKAKVIIDVNPDIILLQQVENRQSLIQFHDVFFNGNENSSYNEIMHLQGNDGIGLGMGILLKRGYRIKSIKSYSNEKDTIGNMLFNSDFQQYKIKTPKNGTVVLLSCQLADENASNDLRKRQAEKVSEVYTNLMLKGYKNIIVVGTLNAPSYSDSISPIIESGILDIIKHSSFSVMSDSGTDASYFRMGAYRMGVNIMQKDYLLASPNLYKNLKKCGMNRKGMWPLKKPEWATYDTLENEKDAASEHPLLWAEFKLEDSIQLYKKSA